MIEPNSDLFLRCILIFYAVVGLISIAWLIMILVVFLVYVF